MLHVFIGEILANMTQVSDVAPGPLVYWLFMWKLLKIDHRQYHRQYREVQFACMKNAVHRINMRICVSDDRKHRESWGHERALSQGVGVHVRTQDRNQKQIQKFLTDVRGFQGSQCVQGEDQTDGRG
jgi:hypothetical protein